MNYVIPLTILIIFQLFRVRKPKPLSEEEKQKIQDRQKKKVRNGIHSSSGPNPPWISVVPGLLKLT
jgi:hypothetical protein